MADRSLSLKFHNDEPPHTNCRTKQLFQMYRLLSYKAIVPSVGLFQNKATSIICIPGQTVLYAFHDKNNVPYIREICPA